MTDKEYLELAVKIGYLNIDKVRNKHVGAIIVHNDRVVSIGFRYMFPSYHGYKYLCSHAEFLALKSIESLQIKDATIYCTTEPCTFRIVNDDRLFPSKPCVEYIIESGKIGKVVFAKRDLWVGSGGEKILNDAGIQTEIINVPVPEVEEKIPEEFVELISPFLEKG